MLDSSRTLVPPRIDAIWEARKQAKQIEGVENSAVTDPITRRALERTSTNRSLPA